MSHSSRKFAAQYVFFFLCMSGQSIGSFQLSVHLFSKLYCFVWIVCRLCLIRIYCRWLFGRRCLVEYRSCRLSWVSIVVCDTLFCNDLSCNEFMLWPIVRSQLDCTVGSHSFSKYFEVELFGTGCVPPRNWVYLQSHFLWWIFMFWCSLINYISTFVGSFTESIMRK